MNEEGAHILVGIVSKRLGESCSQQDYAVFTSVSALLPWIQSSVKENGGMASCRFNFSAPPSLGVVRLINYVKQLRRNVSHCIPNRIIGVLNQNNKTMNIMFRNIVGAPRSTWSSPTRRSINRGTTNFHRDLWLRELYNSPPS